MEQKVRRRTAVWRRKEQRRLKMAVKAGSAAERKNLGMEELVAYASHSLGW